MGRSDTALEAVGRIHAGGEVEAPQSLVEDGLGKVTEVLLEAIEGEKISLELDTSKETKGSLQRSNVVNRLYREIVVLAVIGGRVEDGNKLSNARRLASEVEQARDVHAW